MADEDLLPALEQIWMVEPAEDIARPLYRKEMPISRFKSSLLTVLSCLAAAWPLRILSST